MVRVPTPVMEGADDLDEVNFGCNEQTTQTPEFARTTDEARPELHKHGPAQIRSAIRELLKKIDSHANSGKQLCCMLVEIFPAHFCETCVLSLLEKVCGSLRDKKASSSLSAKATPFSTYPVATTVARAFNTGFSDQNTSVTSSALPLYPSGIVNNQTEVCLKISPNGDPLPDATATSTAADENAFVDIPTLKVELNVPETDPLSFNDPYSIILPSSYTESVINNSSDSMVLSDSGTVEYSNTYCNESRTEEENALYQKVKEEAEKSQEGGYHLSSVLKNTAIERRRKLVTRESKKRPGNTGKNEKQNNRDQNYRYPCNYPDCQRGYSSRRALNRHVEVTHDGRVHKCELCPAEFPYWSSLAYHVSSVHRNIYIVCEKCGCKFRNRAGLKRHLENKKCIKPLIIQSLSSS